MASFDAQTQGQIYSHNIKKNESSNNFSNIDLDQQPASTSSLEEHHSNPNETIATFHPDSLSTADAILNNPSHNSSFSFQEVPPSRIYSSNRIINTSSIPPDRRISVPEMSRLSAPSVAAVAAVGPTIDKFKQWSRSTFKCTKQSIYEKLGKTSRTVDIEVETQIEQLRETKHRYENMLSLARSYSNHFSNLLQTQRNLSDQFLELKQKSFLLCDEFGYNAETQRLLVQNGEILLNALNYFISTLSTLCTKTIEDTLTTIRFYETARLEYDACRTDIQFTPVNLQTNEKQSEFEKYKEKYEQLKKDVCVKLRFLDENQTKVMKKQLLLFHNAIAAYFSGNKELLESTMKQFNLKITKNDDKNSFVEQSNR